MKEWKDIAPEVFNEWLRDDTTVALIEELRARHYARLIEQSKAVAEGADRQAQIAVGKLIDLDEILEILQARSRAPEWKSVYPEAKDDAAEAIDGFSDPGLNPNGDGQWIRKVQQSR